MKAIDIEITDLTHLPAEGRQDGLLLGIGTILSIVIHGTVVAALICVLSWSMRESVAQPVLLTLNAGGSIPAKPDHPSVVTPPRRHIRTKEPSRKPLPAPPQERPLVPAKPMESTAFVPPATDSGATSHSEPAASGSKADDSGRRHEAEGESEKRMARTYLDGHFSYLRELILKRLTYPQEAKRRGYVGRVTVSFVILVSGKVTELAVLSGSGYRILDENVLQTIRSLGKIGRAHV
jgi:protein TonB